MRTSREWWQETKASPEKLMAWLRKQYQGEVTAAERIERYCLSKLPEGDHRRKGLEIIAQQERQHAEWVGNLLRRRGEEPKVIEKTDRYWEKTLQSVRSFEEAAGVAHHAEVMRLERIGVIAADLDAHEDIRNVFYRILKDETFHARLFGELAGEKMIEATRSSHLEGAAAIGFVTASEAA